MDMFNTELATELLIFSVDAIFSIIILKSYNRVGRYINALQEVNAKGANDLKNLSSEEIKYVMVHGPAKALGSTIPSTHVPNTSGVVQKLNTSQIVMTRNSSGFWSDESRTIHNSINAVPFAIVVGKYMIEVQDVQLANELHLDTVYHKYDSTVHSLAANLWSFFFGVRQCGIQTTEEMLKVGTFVTAIGDLMTSQDGSKILIPPQDKPYFITTHSVSSLLQGLWDERTVYGVLLSITGGLSIIFGYRLGIRLWISLKKRRERQEMHRRLEERRRSRRQNARDNEIPDNLRCVVCHECPLEVILLPCGHLCLCEDCSEQLTSSCPVCRSHITSKAAAFIS